MQKELQRDMDQDEKQYRELGCWCNNNTYEKTEAIQASEAKIEELTASIESLTAKSSELSTNIKDLEADYAADKKALDEATALREKQLAEFQNMEKDNIQALENLKAAIAVLSKHQGPENAPASSVAGGAIFKTEKDSWSLLSLSSRDFPWSASHEDRSFRSLDTFMRHHGFDGEAAEVAAPIAPHKFLQQQAPTPVRRAASAGLSDDEAAIVRRAWKSATAFMQSRQGSAYYPAYNSQSGEIFGILKQLEEEMGGELAEAQKVEQERAAAFAELRAAKEKELAEGYAMSEQKEDELANTDNALAEAKEDLGVEQTVLAEDQAFLANLREQCATAEKNFNERKTARLEEIRAVSETISILQEDEARDNMTSTYSFVQMSSADSARKRAAATLLRAAKQARSPEMSMLATSAQLDSFTKVKEAIDKMIEMLKVQQEDEVKHNDWCKAELHSNDMATAKATDKRMDLEARINELEEAIKGHTRAIEEAQSQIAHLQLELQRASEDRKAENLDFQKTVADQTTTIEVLKKALDRLATYYDLAQTGSAGSARRQTPPVPQMEYSKSKGATGVMEMIEKLIHEAAALRDESRKGEAAAQAAYEQLIADTNGSVEALQKEVVDQTQARSDAGKDKRQAESDHVDTVKELEGLALYNGDLHEQCDYFMKNFEVRQVGRQAEIEALQQAKQILSGAALS